MYNEDEFTHFAISKFPSSLNKKLRRMFEEKKKNGEYLYFKDFIIDIFENHLKNETNRLFIESDAFRKMEQTITNNTKSFNDLADTTNENKEILIKLLSELTTLTNLIDE